MSKRERAREKERERAEMGDSEIVRARETNRYSTASHSYQVHLTT